MKLCQAHHPFYSAVTAANNQGNRKDSTTDRALAANVHPNTGHGGVFAEAVATARASATKRTPAHVPASAIVYNNTSYPSPADSSLMGLHMPPLPPLPDLDKDEIINSFQSFGDENLGEYDPEIEEPINNSDNKSLPGDKDSIAGEDSGDEGKEAQLFLNH